jgi:hypothetical protein
VTDLALRLHPRPGLPLSVALGLESGDQRLKGRPIFDVELMIVAGGRLHIEAGAACTGWVGDAALCRATCDGGLFALVREPAAGRLGLRLKIGRIPDAAADTVADGVRLGACADDPAGQRTLQPRSGLRLATLALEGE